MIIICEPICKNFSHEKFNSAFIKCLNLGFPSDDLLVFAHESQSKCLKNIIKNDNLDIKNLSFRNISTVTEGLTGFMQAFLLITKVYRFALKNQTDKVFFLSFNPSILFAIKTLKKIPYFSGIKATMVLHGEFESLAPAMASPVVLKHQLPQKSRKEKILKHGLKKSITIIFQEILNKTSVWNRFVKKKLHLRKMMEWNHSNDFRYISLSPHATENASKTLDTKGLNFYSVVLPTSFKLSPSNPDNEKIKFAVYGYGDSLTLYNILIELEKKNIKTPYEIRIISMDDRGSEGFSNVTSSSNGTPLTRERMEELAADIDIFLILYNKSRYRFTCSGSIMESISNKKPIIHLDNDCMNFFNDPSHPIGVKCDNVEDFANEMARIINQFPESKNEILNYRKNIELIREKFSLENSSPCIKDSFTW